MPGVEYRLRAEAESDENREICRQYWELGQSGKFVHSVAKIADEFQIPKAKVADHVRLYCEAFAAGQTCSSCGAPRPVASRAEYERLVGAAALVRAWVCETCVRLAAEAAAAEQAAKQARRVQVVSAVLEERRATTPLIPMNLSFSDAVYLLSVVRAGASDDLGYIYPLSAYRHALSPTEDFDVAILRQLVRGGALAVHPGSAADSITVTGDRNFDYYISKVHYVLPLPESGPSPARFAEELEAELTHEGAVDNWDPDAVGALHRHVALQECLAYLEHCMSQHGFEPNLGEKTQTVLRGALRSFSVGQVYSFMWRAAKDAAAYQVRERISDRHAANIIPGSIQRMAERAVADKWTVSSFRRRPDVPESTLSHVLFTGVLRLPNGGLDTIPPRPFDESELL